MNIQSVIGVKWVNKIHTQGPLEKAQWLEQALALESKLDVAAACNPAMEEQTG